eukprot:6202072-Pleurochrysis_carterae.AAC.2
MASLACYTVVHAMQNAPSSYLALKAKAAKAAKVKARTQARIDAADAVAATARNNKPHPPPPPRPTSGAKDTQPALGPSPPEDAPSNKLPPERKPPPSDDGRLAEMKARISMLADQQREGANLARQLADLERATAQRAAMRERLSQLTHQMQVRHLQRLSRLQPQTRSSRCRLLCNTRTPFRQDGPALHAGSGSSTTRRPR